MYSPFHQAFFRDFEGWREATHTVHEMARDEARHGKAFKGQLERYFG